MPPNLDASVCSSNGREISKGDRNPVSAIISFIFMNSLWQSSVHWNAADFIVWHLRLFVAKLRLGLQASIWRIMPRKARTSVLFSGGLMLAIASNLLGSGCISTPESVALHLNPPNITSFPNRSFEGLIFMLSLLNLWKRAVSFSFKSAQLVPCVSMSSTDFSVPGKPLTALSLFDVKVVATRLQSHREDFIAVATEGEGKGCHIFVLFAQFYLMVTGCQIQGRKYFGSWI